MTVEDLYILVFYIIDKNGGQGDFSPNEFNIVVNRAQYAYQNYLIGEVQQYQYGRPISRIDYSQNEKIRQKLTPFVYTTTLTITSNKADYPDDYLLTDTMLTTKNDVIRWVSQNKIASNINSVIDLIEDNPIYYLQNDGFYFYPDSLTEANLTYIKKAPAIIYNTEPDTNERQQYTSIGSVDPVWSDIDIFEIAVRTLAIVGVPMQLQQVQAYAQNIKTNGQ